MSATNEDPAGRSRRRGATALTEADGALPTLAAVAAQTVHTDAAVSEPAILALRVARPEGLAAPLSAHADDVSRLREAPLTAILLVLPNVERARAESVAERGRLAVRMAPVRIAGAAIPVTVSIGVAERREGEPREKVIARAESALVRAKDAGRDRVVVAS